MPFELGLAYSRYLYYGSEHEVILLESKSHRLARTLSDLRWIDPLVHECKCGLLVTRVLDAFLVAIEEEKRSALFWVSMIVGRKAHPTAGVARPWLFYLDNISA